MENKQAIKCTAISPDVDLRAQLATEISILDEVEMVRGLTTYMEPENVVRFLHASPAQIVLLDARDKIAALRIASEMEVSDPSVQFIAIGFPPTPEGQREFSYHGIHEVLDLPLDAAALRSSIARRARVLSKLPRAHRRRPSFLSFLPAKPGAGASTRAANFAAILSAEHKTLLCDFDLSSGTIGFRYRLDGPHNVFEMLRNIDHMDEVLWSQLVTNVDGLHVLPASSKPAVDIDDGGLAKLFDFLRGMYDVVVFDLSGSLERHAFTIMRECSSVFMVSTPEVDCLHVGRAKADALREFELHGHTRVLLNRVQKNNLLKRADVADLLKTPVAAEFPNDYRAVQASLHPGPTLSPKSALAKAMIEFAPMLLRERSEDGPDKQFIQYASPSLFQFWRRAERSERWT